jgi:hypothetical protein
VTDEGLCCPSDSNGKLASANNQRDSVEERLMTELDTIASNRAVEIEIANEGES